MFKSFLCDNSEVVVCCVELTAEKFNTFSDVSVVYECSNTAFLNADDFTFVESIGETCKIDCDVFIDDKTITCNFLKKSDYVVIFCCCFNSCCKCGEILITNFCY